MNGISSLTSYLPSKGITIIGGYKGSNIQAYVALYELSSDNSIQVTFPKGHHFVPGQSITLHLDNRTGVEEFDTDLRVNRVSYKGNILEATSAKLQIVPEEFMLFYSNACVTKFKGANFSYDHLGKQFQLPESPVTMADLDWNEKENENKLGVLITRLPSRVHSSLMAFLSNQNDDIFLITFKNSFKSKALHSNNNCCFAIDHRAEFVFEKAYDWNYTIVDAEAYKISENNPLFKEIQYHFVQKNPWETSFFMSPEIEMFHLKPVKILLPDTI